MLLLLLLLLQIVGSSRLNQPTHPPNNIYGHQVVSLFAITKDHSAVPRPWVFHFTPHVSLILHSSRSSIPDSTLQTTAVLCLLITLLLFSFAIFLVKIISSFWRIIIVITENFYCIKNVKSSGLLVVISTHVG